MSDVTTKLAMEASDKAMEIARLKAENAKLRERIAELEELLPDGTLREVADPPTRADLVQVVRCRDCKHCMSYWKSDYCDYFSHVTNDPDGFCAWGERRESE